MTDQTVAPTEVGRTCPYCRFPFKAGVAAHRCDACGALHHADCWQEGKGCAVFGCSGAAAATQVHTAAQPTVPTIPSFAPAPHPPPAPPAGATSPNARTFAWILGCVAVLAAGFGVYALVSKKSPTVTTVVRTGGGGGTSPGGSTATTTQTTTTTAPSPEAQAATQLNGILQYSLVGRSDSQNGNYNAAISNRQEVLSRLAAIQSPDAAITQAVSTLHEAMEASISADRAYATDSNPAVFNDAATKFKTQFVAEWAPIATSFGLPQYNADEI